ncbi:MAG: hypothetical protein ACR2I1_01995, partial [Propionibacteriaceae bacterium]
MGAPDTNRGAAHPAACGRREACTFTGRAADSCARGARAIAAESGARISRIYSWTAGESVT